LLLVTWCSSLNIPFLALLAWHYCCSCCSLFDITWSMFLVLVAIALATPCSTLLVQCFLLNAPCWHSYCSKLSLVRHYCCSFCYSLFNATNPLDVPCLTLLLLLLLVQRHCFSYCLTLLLFLLFFIWHYCSSCLMLLQFCSFILNTICLNTYLLHYDVVLCSLFNVVALALCFKLVFSPLVFFKCGRSYPNSCCSS